MNVVKNVHFNLKRLENDDDDKQVFYFSVDLPHSRF